MNNRRGQGCNEVYTSKLSDCPVKIHQDGFKVPLKMKKRAGRHAFSLTNRCSERIFGALNVRFFLIRSLRSLFWFWINGVLTAPLLPYFKSEWIFINHLPALFDHLLPTHLHLPAGCFFTPCMPVFLNGT